MTTGWTCPRCGGGLSPGTDRCPCVPLPYTPPPYIRPSTDPTWSPNRPDCGCAGNYICMNVACPRRLVTTCETRR